MQGLLCDEDKISGQNIDHRQRWIVDKIHQLSGVFSIDICAYAITVRHNMSLKGYRVESHHQTIVYGTIRSPVNGMMVNLGTQQPIDKGIIQCLDAKFLLPH